MPERERAVVEDRATRVILEPGESLPGPRALEENIADHPTFPGNRLERQETDARLVVPCDIAIEAPKQLVPATNGEEPGIGFDRLAKRIGLPHKVVGQAAFWSLAQVFCLFCFNSMVRD